MTTRTHKLDVRVEGARAVLAGRIGDGCSFDALIASLPAGDVAIDSDGVTFVSSIGMRALILLVRALRARGTVTFERVADVVMTQLNLIPELATSVRIVSFHAPYACPKCGAEGSPVIDALEHAASLRALIAPRPPCHECGAAMELADFPERYLGCFRATRDPPA
jgi:hypothetical protein